MGIFLFFIAALTFAKTQTLHCGRVYNSETATLSGPSTLVFRDSKIESVRTGYHGRADHSFKKDTCLPGLIDTHVHLEHEMPDTLFFHHPDEARTALDSLRFLRKTLTAGFTTVRDLGSPRNIAFQFRQAVEKKEILGPRILAAGLAISSPGGHGDSLSKLQPADGRDVHRIYKDYYAYHFVKNPKDVEAWFNYHFDEKPRWYQKFKSTTGENLLPDAIKVTATGGVVSDNPNSHLPQIDLKTLKEIVRQAKDRGQKHQRFLPVAVHAHGFEGIKNAVEAGVNSIEHASEICGDIEELKGPAQEQRARDRTQLLRDVVDKKIFIIPTLQAASYIKTLAEENKVPPLIKEKTLKVIPTMLKNFRCVIGNKLPIAFGSDTGVSPHGDNGLEFKYLVEYGGLTPLQSLQTATKFAAEALGRSDSLGSLTSGKWADMIVVKGPIEKDITLIQKVAHVFKEGELVPPGPQL